MTNLAPNTNDAQHDTPDYKKLLFDYKYELVYISGTYNRMPDALSRLYTPDEAYGADKLGGSN